MSVLVIASLAFVVGKHASGTRPVPVVALSLTPYADLASTRSVSAAGVAFSRDGTQLAVADRNGNTYLWNPFTVKLIATLASPGSGGITTVAFSPHGRTLAAGGRNGSTYLWWNLAARKRPVLRRTLRCPGSVRITAVAFSPDGTMLAGGSSSRGQICLWNPGTGVRLARLRAGGSGITSIAISPDGKTLAAGNRNGTTFLWNTASAGLRGQIRAPNQSAVTSIAFSPDGTMLAVGDPHAGSYLWKLGADRLITTLPRAPGRSGKLTALAFSPDGRALATADSNGSAYLWVLATGKLIAVLADPISSGVSAVTFSPDGRTVATADSNGHTYLWNPPALPTPTPSPSSAAFLQAQRINNLLARSSSSLSRLNNAITLANQCQDLPFAVSQIQQARNGRQRQLNQSQALQTGALPHGSELMSDLTQALQYSLTADNDYLTWAQEQESSCAPGTSGRVGISDGSNAGATAYKDRFLSIWNPIARQYGFPQRSSI